MELVLCGREGALCHCVMKSKCGEEEGGWRMFEVGGAYGVSVWKAIRKDWEIVGREWFLRWSMGGE